MHETTARDSTVLALAGAAFLTLAGFFLWRDLALPRELLVLAAALLTGTAAALAWPRRLPALAPAALLATTVAAGLWYLAEKDAALLPALAVALAAAMVTVLRSETGAGRGQPLAHRLRWYGLGAAVFTASAAFYFHFLTIGVAADSLARRLVPTVTWLALGLALFIAGRRRSPAAVQVGMALGAIAVGKAALYDTTHLAGGLRVLVLAAVGALLLFGARVLRASAGGRPEVA